MRPEFPDQAILSRKLGAYLSAANPNQGSGEFLRVANGADKSPTFSF
jgi:hypothetical protein